MASNVVSDIADEYLFCQVCLEDFKQPKMLPCLHTFCQPCLEKLLAAEPVGKLDCPTCRQDVPLPQNGVQGLNPNFHVGKLRDILQQQPAGEVAMDEDQVGPPLGLQVRPDVMIGGASLKLVRTVGGKRGSGDGQFNWPTSLAVTAEGDIVVTDCWNSRLQFLDNDGSFKKKVDLGFVPECVAALTNGELLVTGDGHKIHVLDKQGRKSRVIQVTAAEIDDITGGIAVDGSGRIIVTIWHEVFVLSPSGDVMLKFGDKGQGPQQLGSVLHVTVNSSNQIIVSDWINYNLKIFDSAGRNLFTCGSEGSGPGQLNRPICVITDSEDNIIVAERNNCRVSLFSRDGAFIRHVLTQQEHGLTYPMGLTLTHGGHFVVSEFSIFEKTDLKFFLIK
ncbi:hypothetical protein Bbelb_222080 [Branchiostoma belcheri]|nr:hypothetical protein Bbelb_222080 [Branchiostoma belcheri]